jgi:hypothetical protein
MFFDDNLEFIKLNTDFVNPNLFDSAQGFVHGNMFKDEYVAFSDYEIKTPKAKTEQEAYLYMIMELEFAMSDLGLYLDLHPEDDKVLGVFKKYLDELTEYKTSYVRKYGPLELCDTNGKNYSWINNWPWTGKDDMYV